MSDHWPRLRWRPVRSLAVAAALASAAAGSLVAVPTASSYPAYTCGRVRGYVVRSHGPSCSLALRWTSRYLSGHGGPHGYRCRSYGSTVPMLCTSTRRHRGSGDRKNYYFEAGKN